MSVIFLLLGLAIVIFGAELLVRGASALARKLAITEIVIGLTVVAFGTSTPEMVVNIIASIENRSDMALGNIIGSNLFNLLLILGISGLIYPLTVQKNTVWKEIPFSFLMAIALLLLVNNSENRTADILSRNDGFILLLLFTIFITYLFGIAKVESVDSFEVKTYSITISTLLVLGGLGLLVAGGKLCVTGAVGVARNMGLSEKLIASTIIAGGTSLPELATSAVAAFRKKCDIAVGNIIGSNVFNIAILGLSATIRPIQYNLSFNIDLYILLIATVVLCIFMFTGKKHRLDRWEAVTLVLIYISYCTYLVHQR